MPIFHDYKCIFVHIPKVAGESINYVFGLRENKVNGKIENRDNLYGWIDESSSDLRAYKFLSPVLQHLTIRDIKKILPEDVFKNYFKFAFVRNPWDRMVSYYHFSKKSFPKFANHSFIDFLNDLSPYLRQEQCSFIMDDDGNYLVDFIGRFENLENDFKILCDKMQVHELKLSLRNATSHEHYSHYYTSESKKIVDELFKNDIRIFGYKYEKPTLIDKIKKTIMKFL